MPIYYVDNFRNQSAFFRSDAKTAIGMAKAAIHALEIDETAYFGAYAPDESVNAIMRGYECTRTQALYIYQAYTQSVEVYETVCVGGVRRREHVALTFDFVLDAIY